MPMACLWAEWEKPVVLRLRRLLRVRNVRCFPKWNYRAVPEGVCNQGLIADQCLRPFLYPSCGTRL